MIDAQRDGEAIRYFIESKEYDLDVLANALKVQEPYVEEWLDGEESLTLYEKQQLANLLHIKSRQDLKIVHCRYEENILI